MKPSTKRCPLELHALGYDDSSVHAEAPNSPVPPPRWYWMFVIWGIMWILMGLGPLNWLVLPVMAVLVTNAIQSRSWRPLVVFFAAPVPILFLVGSLSWIGNQPSYMGFGHPGPNYYNLHPESRTYAASSGCMIDGGELLRQGPHNLGLALMTQLFGWPPKTYHGSFPTKEQAIELTTAAPLVPLDSFRTGIIEVDGKKLELGTEQIERMGLETHFYFWDQRDDLKPLEVRVASSEDDCVIVRLTNLNEPEPMDQIYFLERRTAWPFARYQIKGRNSAPPYFGAKTGF